MTRESSFNRLESFIWPRVRERAAYSRTGSTCEGRNHSVDILIDSDCTSSPTMQY
ncbi:hypothetical protein Leryth_018814 [Lithospermum erythrorhizon]|nr:hypothetical protein Leryth_018814 [Lithospermum erythrorhizon]